MATSRDLWEGRWAAQAEDLKTRGLYRTLGGHPEAKFGHNDYLGYRRDPRILKILEEAIRSGLPTTSSGSRLLSGNLDGFREFEVAFAKSAGFPNALLFASASEANRAAICTLVDRHDVVVHDALAHASLIDGIVHSGAKRRRFEHNSPDSLRAQLKEAGGKVRLVVTESVFSMDGDVAPIGDLLQVCTEEGALLLVDEAHAVGLFGPNKTGHSETVQKSPLFVATTHGFGKGLASAGGILCCPSSVRDAIVNTSRAFIFTTAPSPLAILAAQSAWSLSQIDPDRHHRLEQLCKTFREGLHSLGWPTLHPPVETPIFPLLCGGLPKAVQISQRLELMGIYLRPIRPPTVLEGTERLRVTITADLEQSDLNEFLGVLNDL